MRIHDRRIKPSPWGWNHRDVASDCLWALKGLHLAWPVWDNGDVAYISASKHAVTDPITKNHGEFTSDAGSFSNTLILESRDSIRGSVVAVTNPGSTSKRIVTRNMADFPTQEVTIVFHYRKLDAVARATTALGQTPYDTTKVCYALLPTTGGHTYFAFGGEVDGTSRIVVSGLTFGDDVWVLTAGARGMEIWQNGHLRASQSGHATRANTATDRWGIWGLSGVFGITHDFAETGGLLVYDHQKSTSEIAALTVDPWTPFRQARRRVYLEGAAALEREGQIFPRPDSVGT